jgi:hypothetical protein
MTLDPYEVTARDPLENTVPDPIERRRRLTRGQRRAVEAGALLVLLIGLSVVRWIDDADQVKRLDAPEHVTVVPRGGAGALGRVEYRMAGRSATAASKGTTSPAGAAKLTLILNVRPLDAQGAKNAKFVAYDVRDRDGHIWTATGLPDLDHDPVAGTTAPVTVTAEVPARLLNSVVLEVRRGPRAGDDGPVQVLRFAH